VQSQNSNRTSSPFKTTNFRVTQGQSTYLGGFGITKPKDVIDVELDVEKRMQAEVLKRQIRIKEFFHDFDRLRKGTVGEAGFRTCLGTLNIRLDESEI
jgi:hypothetical protein